jgi:hypothetical protein
LQAVSRRHRRSATGAFDEAPPSDEEREQDSRSRTQIRDERAHAALAPLSEGERPPALLAAAAVAGLLAVAVAIGTLTIHDLRRHGGSVPGGLFLAGVSAALAVGMYRRRYWAVLGFEALLAFQIIVASLALVVASTLLAAAACLVSVVLGGLLFWKLVRVMGRLQAGERRAVATDRGDRLR